MANAFSPAPTIAAMTHATSVVISEVSMAKDRKRSAHSEAEHESDALPDHATTTR